jgi:hypothetical protein
LARKYTLNFKLQDSGGGYFIDDKNIYVDKKMVQLYKSSKPERKLFTTSTTCSVKEDVISFHDEI